MKETTKIFKALANRRRLKIMKILFKNTKLSVGEISREIKLSFKSTSKHLLKLEDCGLIEKQQVGLKMYYQINHEPSRICLKIIQCLKNIL